MFLFKHRPLSDEDEGPDNRGVLDCYCNDGYSGDGQECDGGNCFRVIYAD